MSSRTILITTDALGDFAKEEPMFGELHLMHVDVGELETPNIVVSCVETGDVFRTDLALAADDFYQPSQPFPIFGTLRVAVTGGGDTKHGRIRFQVET